MTQNAKVLFVDDDPNILKSFQRQLRSKFQIEIAIGAQAGLDTLKSSDKFAIVISDMKMPKMNGIEFLREVEKNHPTTVRLMLTGNVDQETAVKAVNEGHVFRFINKPCTPDELAAAIETGVKQHKLITAERDLLQNTLSGSVRLLTDILSMIDPASFGIALDLKEPIRKYGPALGIDSFWEIDLAAMLGHIGTVVLPADIAEKIRDGEQLSEQEEIVSAQVPETARKLLRNIPRLESVAEIIYYLEKNYDGSGFPSNNTRGVEIPLKARVLRIIRDFKKFEKLYFSQQRAFQQLVNLKGHYDPILVEIFGAALTNEACNEKPGSERFEIDVAKLCVGQQLLEDVYTNDNELLVAAGNTVSELLIQRIQNYSDLKGLKKPIVVDCLIPLQK